MRWLETLKLGLVLFLVFHTGLSIFDGKKCAARAACGSCGPVSCADCGGTGELCSTGPGVPSCSETPGEQSCSALMCLLCRCEDALPPRVLDDRLDSPKFNQPLPTFALDETGAWRGGLKPDLPTRIPDLALSPPQRLAVLCIWRL